jgi:hypothetical protein
MKGIVTFLCVKERQIGRQKTSNGYRKLVGRNSSALTFNGKAEFVGMYTGISTATACHLTRQAERLIQRIIKLALYGTQSGLNLKAVKGCAKVLDL